MIRNASLIITNWTIENRTTVHIFYKQYPYNYRLIIYNDYTPFHIHNHIYSRNNRNRTFVFDYKYHKNQ